MKTIRYTEKKLIDKFNQGDKKALGAVFEMYYKHLFHFAWRLTGNREEAADISMTTLGILLHRYQAFATLENIKAFLYITVRNKSLKYLQFEQKERESKKELSGMEEEKDNFILTQIIRAELLQEIYHEIENLPPKSKNVFKLFYIEGLSAGEIAQLLNMKPGTVRKAKHKALEQLRNTIISKKLLLLLAGLTSLLKFYSPLLTRNGSGYNG